MRIVFSIVGLVVVLLVISRLATHQVQALAPNGQPPAAAAQQTAKQITDAVQAGAALRASEAQQ